MSEVLDPPLVHPVTAALDALTSALDGLVAHRAADTFWGLRSDELVADTVAAHRVINQVEALLHGLVRELDGRGAAEQQGASSTAAWLRGRLRMHPAAAKRLVTTARGLHDDPAGPLVPDPRPATDDATDAEPSSGREALRATFAAGDLSAEHAAVAIRTLAGLPPVDADTADRAARLLAEQARIHDPKALAHLGRHLIHVLDPDAGDQLGRDEEQAVANRRLDVRVGPDGTARVSGRFDAELTNVLLSALDPLAAPRPADPDGTKDARTLPQRRADALAEVLRRYAAAGTTPARHGATTSVTVTMELATLHRHLRARAGWLDWTGPVSAEACRRMACDAAIVPVVLGGNGEPLDVGRASYPVTAAIWRALVARDRGCAFAGCDRLPDWCQAHHRIHWADGGDTSVENCCLLCDYHHRVVHHHGWDLELIDGQIWTIPPPWVDPDRTPRRHTGRAHLANHATLTHP